MRSLIAGVVFCGLAAVLSAQAPAPKPAPARSDCAATPDKLGPDGHWDEASQWLAGLSRGTYGGDLSPEQQSAWSDYSKSIRSDWGRLKKDSLDKIGEWRKRSLSTASGTAFYPFSGPDAANVLAFFSDAKEFVLIGLEPVGCVPAAAADYGPSYFTDLRQSVRSIVALGFFKTVDMHRDFHESEVTGVLPVLLLSMARSGYSIMDVTSVGIMANGTIAPAAGAVKRETSGVAIQFKDDRHGVRTLRYFSLNLENSRLAKKPGTMKYLQSLPTSDTLIKSASYLMHKKRFSTIRSVILDKSRVVVQDDSGILFGLFPATIWDIHLYGTYTKPINLFKDGYQDDLDAAFVSGSNVQPLDFGIGYRWRRNESNLMVAVRREPVH